MKIVALLVPLAKFSVWITAVMGSLFWGDYSLQLWVLCSGVIIHCSYGFSVLV